MIRNVGKMICRLREERGLWQEQLGRGLAGPAELARLESGDGEGSRFLLEALFQRMGKSVDKLEMSVTDTECRMMILRALVLESFRDRDYEAVDDILEEYGKLPGGGEPLHRQYVQGMKALRVYALQGDRETCIGLLEEAVGMTCPDWRVMTCPDRRGRKPGEFLLCTQEIQFLMLLLAVLSERDDARAAERKLWELWNCLEGHYSDEEEMARVYPQCAWILGRVCAARGDWETAYEVCRCGRAVLSRTGLLAVTEGLLEIQEICLEKTGREEEAHRVAETRKAFSFLYELADSRKPEKDLLYLLLVSGKQEILVSRELLKDMRLAKGWSQEQLSEGICSWETLSRIERGRQSPHRKNLYKMYRKLGLDREKYYGYISSDDFKLYEKVHEMQRIWFRGDHEEATALMEEIAGQLDMKQSVNRQFIETHQLLDAVKKGKMKEEDVIQRAEELLRITMKDYEGIVYRAPFRQECVLLNQIALGMKHSGREEEAIRLWEQMLNKFQKRKAVPEYPGVSEMLIYMNGVSEMLIYMNYPGALETGGYLEKSEQEAVKGIKMALKCQRGDAAAVIMANLACVYEKRNTQEDAILCEQCLRNSFYVFQFYGYEKKSRVVNNFYIKKYGRSIAQSP